MLKVPSSQIDVKHDTALEMPHQVPSERRQRPSSVSSKFSLRPPDVDLEQFQPLAFFCLKRESKPRIWFIKLMSWPWFERVSILVILVNCVTLGMYNPFDTSCVTGQCQVLERLETAIYAFFLLEMLIKWFAMGLFGKQGYFKDSWNKLDCFIVAAGSFELAYGEGEYLSAVRSIRVLRPLRAINRVPSIRILVMLLLDTLPMLGNVLAICFFIFAIFGIIGVQLWQGLLRSRCFPDSLNATIITAHNLSSFYIPSFDEPDYVCSLPGNNGLSKCDKSQFDRHDPTPNQSYSPPVNTSSYWNKYYTTCRDSGENIYWGSISFDNIGIATVAIFQIITLEGWTDIMYKIQDAHSFWNWLYFVVLILLGSYFMTNLCLVVITSQFQETKQRETEFLRLSRLRRSRPSVSTLSSSFMQQGCYTQILHYLEYLCRRSKRRVKSWLKIEKTNSKRRRVKPCIPLKNRKDNVKSIHHHHHHYHYYHHYVHHHPCPCSSEISDSPPVSSEPAVSVEMPCGMSPPPAEHALGVTQDTQDSRSTKEGKRILVVPQIQVITQAATALYKDTGASSSGEMVSTATANINVQGRDSSASVVTYSKSADAVTAAAQATNQTIEAVCSCAAQQSGEESNHVVWKTREDSADSSEDDRGNSETKRDKSCFQKFRENTKLLVEGTRFTRVIMVSIFLNTICMAVEHHGQPEKMTDALEVFNIIFTSVFALEMMLKITAFGPYGYIKDAYNLFDGVIVIVSLMDILAVNDTSGISVLRSFRLLRIFKLVRFMPALQRQLSVMVKTLDNVMTFLALLALFIFTSSILGMHLFGGKYQFPDEDGKMVTSRANFDTLFWALVTVFQVLTQEDWNVVLYDGMRSLSSWTALYFIFLMIIGNYILFNLLVAILVEGFADHSENERLSIKGDKNTTDSLFLSAKPQKKRRSQPDTELALSWPNINSMLQEENTKQLPRCSSAPGRQGLSEKPQRSTSYLHVLTVDALESGHSAEETGNKCERVRCTSPEDEDSSLVAPHSKKNSRDSSVVKNTRSSFFKRREYWSLYVFSPENRFRQVLVKIHSHVWFDRVVLLFILFNCLVMALEEPNLDRNSKKGQFIHIMQYIFTAIFTVEMSIKVISLGLIVGPKTYLRSGWNIIDGVLVLFSLVDLVISLTTDTDSGILGVLRVFRAFRTLRPLRVINRAPELKLVVETLLTSLKPIGNVVLIAATFFTIFGILGVQLFKGKFFSCHLDASPPIEVKNKSECLLNKGKWVNNEYNFDNLARALLTLFVFATRDGWVSIMYSGVDVVEVDEQPQRDHSKWNVLYFVAFLLLAGFVVLNMLVGIVVENFHKCRNELLKEQNAHKSEKNDVESQSRRNSISDIDYEGFPRWRQKMFFLVTHDYFDLAIAVVIGVNVLCMAMEHYNQPENLTLFLKYANYLFTIMFIFEAILKILALGFKNYLSNRWNCLDMMIVILSIGGIILDELATSDLPINPTIIRVMRVLRITRVLKLLKTAEGIRSLLDTVGKALPQVANLGMLFLLLFFIFGALGMELFGKISCDKVECEGLDTHAHFRNFGYSVLTLFRVSTGDNWNGILKDTINSKRCDIGEIDGCEIIQTIAPMYFAAFVLITQFVLLNVVVAVMMKHLEESKVEENAKPVKKHSPATPRLFLGKSTPDMPRRSKNSPRLSKASQQSLRSRKSESGILKNKGSLSVDGNQRRSKSMDEIRNNNDFLSYNSGSDSDCCFDDLSLGKDVKISPDLRQRKPSVDNCCKNTDFNGNSCTDTEISRKSVKSKKSNPVLEIVDVGDSESSEHNGTFPEPYVKSSGLTAKELIPLVKVSEPFVGTSDPLVKTSEQEVKNSLPFEVNQDDKNELKNDRAKRDDVEKEERSCKDDERNVFSSNTASEEKLGKGKQDKTKTEVLKEKNESSDKVPKKNEGIKRPEKQTDESLNDNKEMDLAGKRQKEKKGRLNIEKKEKVDGEEKEKCIKGQSNIGEKTGSEMNRDRQDDVLKKKTENQDRFNKDKLPDEEVTEKIDEKIKEKDDRDIELGHLKQSHAQKKPLLKQPVKNNERVQQDLKPEIRSQASKRTQKQEELNVESQVNLMDNKSERKDSNKDLSGSNEGSLVNPIDNTDTLGVNQGSRRNLMDNNNQKEISSKENSNISGIQDEGNTRTHFHGIRLDPLPENASKLTPPASNI